MAVQAPLVTTWSREAVLAAVWEHVPAHAKVDLLDVLLEESAADAQVAIVFRHRSRPGCTFRFRWPVMPGEPEVLEEETPADWASLAGINLGELIEAADYGLPADCRADEVTDVGFESTDRRRL
jgi:hypothetical protein